MLGYSSMKEFLMKPFNTGSTTLFICQSGSAIVLLYNKKYIFKKGDILIANWDMHPVFLRTSREFSTFFCVLSESVFFDVFRNISDSFCQFVFNYPIFKLTAEQTLQLTLWLKQFSWISQTTNNPQKQRIVINYLQSLMLVIDLETQRASRLLSIDAMPRQLEILRAFGALLHTHIKEHHDVAFYAQKLSITTYYLSTITAKVMRESPKSLIDKQLIEEVKKRVIINTPLKIIADQLYFQDTSYMRKFFKRHTNLSISEFKDKNLYV